MSKRIEKQQCSDCEELNALEIIRNKPFNNMWFTFYHNYDDYYENAEYADKSKRLTEDEWNILKELFA